MQRSQGRKDISGESMPSQSQMGKSFEYAVARSIYESLSGSQAVSICSSPSVAVAAEYYDQIDEAKRSRMRIAAATAIRHIIRLEPQLEFPEGNSPLLISIQNDATGQRGDVRDVVRR